MVAAKRTELSFAERFCGPPGSANGGFACGSIAELLGDDLIAEAHLATVGADVPGVASLAQAQAAAERYPLYQGHPFPACFTCGPERAAGDGLRISPGPVTGSELWAAPWAPDSSVADGGGWSRPRWCGRRWTVPAGSPSAPATL